MASRGSSKWRAEEWGDACVTSDIVGMAIYAGGPRFQCHRLAREWFTLLGAKFLAHRYVIQTAGGYNCRRITGGTSSSSHSWGISLDVNEARNPYRRDRLVTDMPMAMIEDIYTIVTIDGIKVFRWGGDWDGRPEVPNSNYDAMHFEIVATPEELERGYEHTQVIPIFADVRTGGSSTASQPVLSLPVIRRGARGPLVVQLQDMLGLQRTTGNGIFGPRTEVAVRRYQLAHGLTPDGIVGHATWTALTTHQPSLAISGVSPQKVAA